MWVQRRNEKKKSGSADKETDTQKVWVQIRSGVKMKIQRGCEENNMLSNKLIKRAKEIRENVGVRSTVWVHRSQRGGEKNKVISDQERKKLCKFTDKDEKEQFGFR